MHKSSKRNAHKSAFVLGMLMTISSVSAHAQDNGVISVIGGNSRSSTGSVLGTPGTYTVETYDRAVLEKMAVENFRENQKEGLDFLLKVAERIETELKKVSQLNIAPGGFFDLYNKSQNGVVTAIDYTTAQQTLQNQINLTQAALESLFLVPSSIMPRENVEVRGSTVAVLPAKLRVELDEMKASYVKQINAIISQVKVLTFNVRLNNSEIASVTGISWMAPTNKLDYKFLEQERISAMRDATVDLSQLEIVNDLNRHNLSLIRSNIKAFGTSQKYRFNLNSDGRDRNLENLAEAFWARNYLRAIYGAKLGVIAVDYTKRQVNWDFFATDNKLQFMGEFLTSDSDLVIYQDLLANALVTYEARNKEVFGEGVEILSRIMSGLTFLKGESQLASINVVALQLLKIDIEMDQMLGKPGGLKAVREAYRKLYYSTPAAEEIIRSRAAAYEDLITMESEDSESDLLIIGQTSDLKTEFIKSVQALNTIVDKADQAKRRLKAIDTLRGENKSRDNVRKRIGDL